MNLSESTTNDGAAAGGEGRARRSIRLAPSPHLADALFTTRRMMIEVLIGLAPALIMAIVVFRWYAVVQVALCTVTCVATESVAAWMRGRRSPVGDYSAAVTGIILGLSLPWSAPWYVAVIGSVVAIGLGKAVFGGLGWNIFNPAMVGRAFVMLSFAKELGASAYVLVDAQLPILTRATPLTIAKKFAADLSAGRVMAGELRVPPMHSAQDIWALLIGQVNGSLGETSALALALGGFYLCVRRVVSWEIPLGIFATAFVFVELSHWTQLTPFTPLQHLVSGSLVFGAFFIATDPVTSPLTPLGKFLFGVGIGVLVVVIRVFSGYPEGVMFAVLLMNATVPLLNRWTIPRPFGATNPEP